MRAVGVSGPRVRAGVAAVLLATALVLGATHTVHAARSARTAARANADHPRRHDRLRLLAPQQEDFLDFVRATVPQHARVRIVRPVREHGHVVGESCTAGVIGPAYWWIVYALAPRASVCAPDTAWTVYFGIAPPPGGTVYRFADEYAVVHR